MDRRGGRRGVRGGHGGINGGKTIRLNGSGRIQREKRIIVSGESLCRVHVVSKRDQLFVSIEGKSLVCMRGYLDLTEVEPAREGT